MAGVLTLGALVLYAALPPTLQKVSVEGAPLDPKNTSEARFIIANIGVLPVFDLQLSYTVTSLQTEDGLRGSAREKTLFVTEKSYAGLWPDEKREIDLPIKKLILSPVRFVDMSITVQYRPIARIPFYKREQSFHFMTSKNKGGLLGWYLQPSAKSAGGSGVLPEKRK